MQTRLPSRLSPAPCPDQRGNRLIKGPRRCLRRRPVLRPTTPHHAPPHCAPSGLGFCPPWPASLGGAHARRPRRPRTPPDRAGHIAGPSLWSLANLRKPSLPGIPIQSPSPITAARLKSSQATRLAVSNRRVAGSGDSIGRRGIPSRANSESGSFGVGRLPS